MNGTVALRGQMDSNLWKHQQLEKKCGKAGRPEMLPKLKKNNNEEIKQKRDINMI